MNDNDHSVPAVKGVIEGTYHNALVLEDEVYHDALEEVDPLLEQTSVVPIGFQKRPLDDPIIEADDALAKRQKTCDALISDSTGKIDPWDVMFERLSAYKKIHGDCLVPKRYAADPELGTWVETQRIQYKKLARDGVNGEVVVCPNNRLTLGRLGRLRSLDFAWSAAKGRRSPSLPDGRKRQQPTFDERRLRIFDQQWDYYYQRLVQYKAKHGDTAVPRKHPDDPELANWCEAQRVLWSREYPLELEAHEVPEAMDLNEDVDIAEAVETSVFDESTAEVRNDEDLLERVPIGDPAASGGPEENSSLQSEMSTSLQPQYDHRLKSSAASGATSLPNSKNTPAELSQVEALSASDGTDMDGFQFAATATSEAVTDWKEGADPAVTGVVEESADADDSKPAPKYLTQERKTKLNELGFVWCIRTNRVAVIWDDMFKQLVEYKEKNGDCLVPSRYEENPKLGKWVETQRYEFTKLQRKAAASPSQVDLATEKLAALKPSGTNPRLTEERLRRLESIGFEWKVKNKMKRYYDKQWEQMFERLSKFKEEHSHCMVPKRYPLDAKLGSWVNAQRCQYRKMTNGSKGANGDGAYMSDSGTEEEEGSRLTEDRRRRLSELGFVWLVREVEKVPEPGGVIRNSYDDQWDAMFESLAAYKERHGHCLVPKRYKEDPKLGTWVDTQRVQYKKMKKKLNAAQGPQRPCDADSGKPLLHRFTDERIRRLEDLGFVWSIRDDWQKHYEELKEYKNDNGNCNVPARYAKNRRLGIWVSAQRQQYKILKAGDEAVRKSTPLTQQRIDLLNELGFTWAVRSRDSLGESWSQRLVELQEYKKQHGNCLVPARYSLNPELGVWVGTQRTQYRLLLKAKEERKPTSSLTSMTDERIKQLTDLGFVFTLRELRGQDGTKDSDVPLPNAESEAIIEQEAVQEIAGGGSEPGSESGGVALSSSNASASLATVDRLAPGTTTEADC